MRKILDNKIIEKEKSSFVIDIVKLDDEQLYVEVKQTIFAEKKSSLQHELKIHRDELKDLIIALNTFYNKIKPNEITIQLKPYFNDKDEEAIIQGYLKGVRMKDLLMRFDCTISDIIKVLEKNNIAVVSNKLPEDLE